MKYIEYSHINNGGNWWLTKQHWLDLQSAGWMVNWHPEGDDECPATEARRYGLSYDEAVTEWTKVTGLDPDTRGCPCCSQPHWFCEGDTEEDDDE